MQDTTYTVIECEIVAEDQTVSLGELCRSCGVHAEWVSLLVEHGVLEPQTQREETRWVFGAREVPRVHTALRLQQDLGLNMAGVALALELTEEIQSLRRQLDAASRGD